MTPINKNVVINKYNDVCDKVAKMILLVRIQILR